MSLFITELRRLAKRRFIRYMALAGLLVLILVAGGTFLSNHKVGPEQIAAAEQSAEQNYQDNLKFHAEHVKECERVRDSGTAEEKENFPDDCSMIEPPSRDMFEAEWFMPPTFDFRKKFGEAIFTFSAILALVAFVAGASFIGAEWTTGGMMNLLLWRPQRLKVLLTKAGALLTGLTGLTVVTALLWTAAHWVTATYRGITDTMTSGAWQSFALTGLRGLGLVLVAGLIGFALAAFGRHTAVALGGALGALVVGQFGLAMVLRFADVRFFEAWLLPTYALAWMERKLTLTDWESCNYSTRGGCEPKTMDILWQDAGVLFAVAVVLMMGVAMWTMRRRDIT
ncbi:MAG TPA: ABC transporter permease subunit [Micromonosporaceae bacterium]|nr:ABC transporter permease subunit [Micromonosporaceae bacterium]